MTAPLDVHLEAGRIEAIADRLGATDGQIAFAVQAAANHAARLAQRMSLAKMNAGLGVSAAGLRRRLKATTANGVKADGSIRYSSGKAAARLRNRARVWWGLNPVDPFKLSVEPHMSSDIRSRTGGVTAGRYRWDGAFIARRKKGNTQTSGGLAVFKRRGKESLPIVRQFADIRAQALAIITSDIFPKIADQFYERFEKELLKELARA